MAQCRELKRVSQVVKRDEIMPSNAARKREQRVLK